MHPIFHLGIIELPAYGSIIFIGLLVGTVIAMLTAHRYEVSRLDIMLSTILATIGLLIGAKVVYMISVLPEIVTNFHYVKSHIFKTIVYMFSGYVFYGGLIGALLTYYFYCWWFKINFGSLMNVITPVIPLVHSFGRIGCFMGGCCYGIKYNGRLAIHYPYNEFEPELNLFPRFPVQLTESLINFLFFLILITYAKKKRPNGSILGIYLIGYAIIRFSLEFLRGDVERGIWFGVSTSQWISLILIPVGIHILRKTYMAQTKKTVEKKAVDKKSS